MGDQAGSYTVELDGSGPPLAMVAFGPSIARSHTLSIVAFRVGELIALGGLIVVIVGFVKRRRHKRELRVGAGDQPGCSLRLRRCDTTPYHP